MPYGAPMAKILVIDDVPEVRSILSRWLRQAGHEVAEAEDGSDGLQRFCSTAADLVITDLYMPENEGIETIVTMRKLFPTAKIIAMSGRLTSNSALQMAQQLGAAGVLRKPFTVHQSESVISHALASTG